MADVPSFREKLILRFTFARIADVFNTCELLPEPEKQAAYDEIKRRIKQIGPVRADRSGATQTFTERCRELAALAPNDKIKNIMLMIAQICEAEVSSSGDSSD
jgi:hypothetical protein